MFTRAEEDYDAMRIHEIDIQDYARQLLEAHGAQAVVEAAQKACAFEMGGKKMMPKSGGTLKQR